MRPRLGQACVAVQRPLNDFKTAKSGGQMQTCPVFVIHIYAFHSMSFQRCCVTWDRCFRLASLPWETSPQSESWNYIDLRLALSPLRPRHVTAEHVLDLPLDQEPAKMLNGRSSAEGCGLCT